MIQLLISNNPRNIKKLIHALLKSKNASQVLSHDYIKSYQIIDNKITKNQHKILYIYSDKTSDSILSFAQKTFPDLQLQII